MSEFKVRRNTQKYVSRIRTAANRRIDARDILFGIALSVAAFAAQIGGPSAIVNPLRGYNETLASGNSLPTQGVHALPSRPDQVITFGKPMTLDR